MEMGEITAVDVTSFREMKRGFFWFWSVMIFSWGESSERPSQANAEGFCSAPLRQKNSPQST